MAKFLQLALWIANGWYNTRKNWKHVIFTYYIDVMLISETHFTENKLSKTSHLYSLSYKPSSRNCWRWYCYDNKKFNQASPVKQL
jgi:hypothetical protein